MFDKAYIVARLQNGEDVQKIADEMAKMINEAQDEYKAQKAEAEKVEVQKKEELTAIVEMYADWFCKYYGYDREKITALNVDTAIELIEECMEYVDALTELESILKPKKTAEKTIKKEPQSVLDDFIKEMGW